MRVEISQYQKEKSISWRESTPLSEDMKIGSSGCVGTPENMDGIYNGRFSKMGAEGGVEIVSK